MRIAIASDHAGFELKETLAKDLREQGHEVMDLGACDSKTPTDYPDAADHVGSAVTAGRAERGVIVCGSGVGVCAAVNKFPGIVAAVCHDTYSARQGVEHDDMNVLCIGQRIVGRELAREVLKAFVGAAFSGDERHVRRLGKLKAIERRFLR